MALPDLILSRRQLFGLGAAAAVELTYIENNRYISPATIDQVLFSIDRQFRDNENLRIQGAISGLNQLYESADGEAGIEGQTQIDLRQGLYVLWNNIFDKQITSNSRLSVVNPVQNFTQGGWGVRKIAVVGDGSTVHIPTGGRVLRIAPSFIPNKSINFDIEGDLNNIASTHLDLRDRITTAVTYIDTQIDNSDQPIAQLITPKSPLGEGEYLVISDYGNQSPTHNSYLSFSQGVRDFSDGAWGLSRVSVPYGKQVVMPTEGRALRLGGKPFELFMPFAGLQR